MTNNKSPIKYNKQQQKQILEDFESYLFDNGIPVNSAHNYLCAARVFFDQFGYDLHEVDAPALEKMRTRLLKNHKEVTVDGYIRGIGKLVEFVTGQDPWRTREGVPSARTDVVNTVRSTPCHLNREIRVWIDSCTRNGLAEGTIEHYQHRVKVAICILNTITEPKTVETYSYKDYLALQARLQEMFPDAYNNYLNAFSLFIKFYTGVDFRKDSQHDLKPLIESWAQHLREKGLKESSVRSMSICISSVMKNLEREFGRAFDPYEVDAKILRALFNRCITRIKETTLCGYFTAFASFHRWLHDDGYDI